MPFDKATVKDAPNVDPDGQLSQREEAELYRHYGLDYCERARTPASPRRRGRRTDRSTATAVGGDVSGPKTDDAMTRSEEELRVGTAERETGRVRLRKYIVEDEVSRPCPCAARRSASSASRSPTPTLDDATSGPEISEEEHEVTLHEEEPVAEKRVVPKERVRLDKDVEVEERTVSEDVRREEIEIDDGGGRTDRA